MSYLRKIGHKANYRPAEKDVKMQKKGGSMEKVTECCIQAQCPTCPKGKGTISKYVRVQEGLRVWFA